MPLGIVSPCSYGARASTRIAARFGAGRRGGAQGAMVASAPVLPLALDHGSLCSNFHPGSRNRGPLWGFYFSGPLWGFYFFSPGQHPAVLGRGQKRDQAISRLKMSSSSSSSTDGVTAGADDLRTVISILKGLILDIYTLKKVCLSIEELLSGDEEFDMDLEEDSSDEECSRKRIGTVAAALGASGVSESAGGSIAATGVGLASVGDEQAEDFRMPKAENLISQPRRLFRFR